MTCSNRSLSNSSLETLDSRCLTLLPRRPSSPSRCWTLLPRRPLSASRCLTLPSSCRHRPFNCWQITTTKASECHDVVTTVHLEAQSAKSTNVTQIGHRRGGHAHSGVSVQRPTTLLVAPVKRHNSATSTRAVDHYAAAICQLRSLS